MHENRDEHASEVLTANNPARVLSIEFQGNAQCTPRAIAARYRLLAPFDDGDVRFYGSYRGSSRHAVDKANSPLVTHHNISAGPFAVMHKSALPRGTDPLWLP
jgi:hypothetical protein